jgi:hypothetical protein
VQRLLGVRRDRGDLADQLLGAVGEHRHPADKQLGLAEQAHHAGRDRRHRRRGLDHLTDGVPGHLDKGGRRGEKSHAPIVR